MTMLKAGPTISKTLSLSTMWFGANRPTTSAITTTSTTQASVTTAVRIVNSTVSSMPSRLLSKRSQKLMSGHLEGNGRQQRDDAARASHHDRLKTLDPQDRLAPAFGADSLVRRQTEVDVVTHLRFSSL
jgi:uncharacterized membrane protein